MKYINNFKVVFSMATMILITGCATLSTPGSMDSNMAESTSEQNDKMSSSGISNPAVYSSRENAATVFSDEGKYRVSLFSNEFPLQVGKIYSWTAHIERENGEPLENAKIYVHGGMPAHQHDFPTKPRVTEYLGNGDYKIEGVKFSMPGQWEMRLNIKELDKLQRDRVVFTINL